MEADVEGSPSVPYYAVKVGNKPGIYTTWAEASAQVSGFKGALFKKFPTRAEAESFMEGDDLVVLTDDSEERFEHLAPGHWHAFVDGSYNVDTQVYGYGVLLYTDQGPQELSGSGQGEVIANSRNVAGEILAAETVMDLALKAGAQELTIYHDYSGLRHFALSEWKPDVALTQEYAAKAHDFQAHCKLHFVKVDAHSGHRLNNRADVLAKQGAGI